MAEHALGQGKIQRHQHGGPQDGVEPQDLLTHDVQVRGPEFVVIVICFIAVAQSRDVVGKRVHPDVHGVLGVERDGNAPLYAGAGNAGVLQALVDESDHLVFARFRLNEIRMLFIQLQQAVRIFPGFEEIGFFLGLVHGAAAVRALAVHKLAVCPEAFARLTVMPFVNAFVDIALLVKPGENFLAALHMVIVGGADESVVGNVHQFPQLFDAGDDLIHIFLRRHTFGRGLVLNFLPVLIGARQIHHIIALHALIPRDGVADDGGVAVADVQLVAGVVDRCGDVEGLFIFHRYQSLSGRANETRPFYFGPRGRPEKRKMPRRLTARHFGGAGVRRISPFAGDTGRQRPRPHTGRAPACSAHPDGSAARHDTKRQPLQSPPGRCPAACGKICAQPASSIRTAPPTTASVQGGGARRPAACRKTAAK